MSLNICQKQRVFALSLFGALTLLFLFHLHRLLPVAHGEKKKGTARHITGVSAPLLIRITRLTWEEAEAKT